MTTPSRRQVEKRLRSWLAERAREEHDAAGGLPALSEAKWILDHLHVLTGRPRGRGKGRG